MPIYTYSKTIKEKKIRTFSNKYENANLMMSEVFVLAFPRLEIYDWHYNRKEYGIKLFQEAIFGLLLDNVIEIKYRHYYQAYFHKWLKFKRKRFILELTDKPLNRKSWLENCIITVIKNTPSETKPFPKYHLKHQLKNLFDLTMGKNEYYTSPQEYMIKFLVEENTNDIWTVKTTRTTFIFKSMWIIADTDLVNKAKAHFQHYSQIIEQKLQSDELLELFSKKLVEYIAGEYTSRKDNSD